MAKKADMTTPDDPWIDDGEWIECWKCYSNGRLPGCFEDCCSCTGDPDDADFCCAPSRCDVCKGKGGWPYQETATPPSSAESTPNE